ncbi:cytoplasmic dynein 1 intermediate chain 2-like isoform X1 [Biomphalaria glabrata]|uniref:Cytoplasmic dynein 1 intermediate chain 2-like isoform X1 n=2 Tax=Biomphalaria glabrata TaxID=6526 RepID=A0A9W2YA43_BIOGL|nr:cytoplasmic dynein 1 intermediate chain 2-like isoform X1 [Biomphalaria glabrata]
MADRRAEIARKKAQIEQLRKERKEKEIAKKEGPVRPQAATGSPSDPDALFRDLGIPITETPAQPTITSSLSAPISGPDDSSSSPVTISSPRRRNVQLSIVKVNETNIPPKENVAYSKETQTINPEPIEKDGRRKRSHSHGSRGPWDYYGFGSPKFVHPHMEWDDEFFDDLEEVLVYDNADHTDDDTDSLDVSADAPHGHQMAHRMPRVEMVAPPSSEEEKKEEKPPAILELSEEEKKQIIMSEEYQLSVSRAARVMQRMLALNDTGLTIDYSGADMDGKDDDSLAGERLKLQLEFFDEKWSKRRTITGMDWSPQYPELLLASYNANEDAPNDPDGVALIWNLKFKNMDPEYIFHCQSSVMSTCFAQFHPNLVIGGTYSGRIVLWDNRVNKRTPVQRTPLSATSHTHPVYCVNVVGTQNAHNLISVSTDGKLCSWSLDMLSQPQDSMELQSKQNKSVAATCFSFLSGDANNFIVGSEECITYSACRHGSKAGINDAFEGHQGPITSIDTHKVPGQIDFSPYFLTSSFDWTIKLWSIKQPYYIHSFEDNNDYVYDVRWSPIHPALFASVDGEGRLDLWNLNSETEVPTASITVDGRPALNQLRWHQTGHHIGVGDNNGRIHVYDVGEHIANPRSDEWSNFVHTQQELKQHAAEREEDSSLAGSGAPLR